MDKLSKLEQLLKDTNTKQEFNIVEDLKALALSYGVVKSKDFRKKLNALIEKYENDEFDILKGTRHPGEFHRYKMINSADRRYVLLKVISE